jgi:hypothetical protein
MEKSQIYTRVNYLNGRYDKGNFGLTGIDYSSTPDGELLRKADLVDEMISREASRGKNVDDPQVLQTIATAIQETSVPEKTFLGGLISIAVIGVILFFLASLFF